MTPAGDEAREINRALAREAEPLRPALARFFSARVPDAAEVDDLVQEVFTRILAREAVTPVEHLGGFVFQMAANVLADRARRRFARRADTHVAFDPDHHADQDIDPFRVLSGKQDLQIVAAALLTLPARTRAVFLLNRIDGHRHREIARRLGISVSAVEKHMVRAIHHLSLAFGAAP